jgi:hypothetical protein
LSAASAQAGFVYSYSFDQPNYSLAPGATVSVPVYFQESVDGGDVSLLATQDGLAVGSVQLQRTSLDSAVGITNVTLNPGFDGVANPTIGLDLSSLYVSRSIK